MKSTKSFRGEMRPVAGPVGGEMRPGADQVSVEMRPGAGSVGGETRPEAGPAGGGQKAATLSIIKYDIRRFWYVPALFLIALLIAGPIGALLMTSSGKERNEYLGMISSGEHPLFTFLFFALSIAAGLAVLEYLQKNRISNYIHSLPVKRSRLFAVNYCTGLAMLMIPVLITGIILMVFSGDYSGYALWIIISWLACALTYSIAVFAGNISGTVFMHLFNCLFFYFAVAMMIAAVDGYAGMMLHGYTTPEAVSKALTCSIPMIGLYGKAPFINILIYLASFIVLTIISSGIYKKRAVENTGQTLVFNWTKSLIIGIVTFLGTCFMGVIFRTLSSLTGGTEEDIVLLVGMAFGFLLSFIVISLIVYKGIRIFSLRNMATALAVILVTALFSGSMYMDVLGYEKKVFDPDEFTYIGIKNALGTYDSRFDTDIFSVKKDQTDRAGDGEAIFCYRDEDNKKAICDMQKILAESKGKKVPNEGNYVDGEYGQQILNIDLTGLKESGGEIKRSYTNIDEETFEKISTPLGRIYGSKEFKDTFALSNLKYKVERINITLYAAGTDDIRNETEITTKTVPQLITAMDRDFKVMTYEDQQKCDRLSMSTKPEEDYYMVNICLNNDDESELMIIVTKDQVVTWKWLNDYLNEPGSVPSSL